MSTKPTKAVVAFALTVAYFALAYGLVPDQYVAWLNVVFAVGITYGVWQVPNNPKPE